MYYDSYAPRSGSAAMPSPYSKQAPYFSGHHGTFDNFLDEFEALAYDCRLTDPQKVDGIVCYIESSFREVCKSMEGYQSRRWSHFRYSLINFFGAGTSHHQLRAMERKLCDFVENSSRMRMEREDHVVQYYQDFQYYIDPLVHAGYLTETDSDVHFWYGFHPRDRDILWPRLLVLRPSQSFDIPFQRDDVFHCARRTFEYKSSPSFAPYPRSPSPYSTSSSELRNAPTSLEVQSESMPEPECVSTVPSTTPDPAPYTTSPASSCIDLVLEPKPECIVPIAQISTSAPSHVPSCTDVVSESEVSSTPMPVVTPASTRLPEIEHLTPFPPTSLPSSKSNEVILAPAPSEASKSKEQILEVAPQEVSPEVVSTPANIQVPPRSLSDHSHAASSSFSIIETTSSNISLSSPSNIAPVRLESPLEASPTISTPSSPSKITPICLAPPPEDSPTIPTYASLSQLPNELARDSFLDSSEDAIVTVIAPFSTPPRGIQHADSNPTPIKSEVAPVLPSSSFPSIPQQQLTFTPVDKEQDSTFVTAAMLRSAFVLFSFNIVTYPCKFRSKVKDFNGDRIGTHDSGKSILNQFAQHTFHHARFVFDPGGAIVARGCS